MCDDADVLMQVFQVPSDSAGIVNPRCSLEPSHSDGVQSLYLSGTTLFSGGRDMSVMKWDLTDTPQLKQVYHKLFGWWHSIVVRTLVSAGELSLSCARLLAGCVTTLQLSHPLSASQHGQLSHPSLRGR